jgi:mannose-6-phosphate isomerase
MALLLSSSVMPYAWGSRTAIAELLGRASPSAGPEAELWMGAHPVAPSTASGRRLDEIVSEAPEARLGERVVAAFGARLPFLLKVIAAAEPLSIQAHPNAEQARAGWEDEERRGVPRDAPHRNYRDASHKPELVCALTPFDALCGFRRIDEILALFEPLERVAAVREALAPLRARRDLPLTFRALMALSREAVEETVAACEERGGDAASLALRLAKLYPGDVGVVSALLLNHVRLAPGEAIYLGAGSLHAYLGGTAIEIMASSDNVLRGGLTKKHVDVPELEKVLLFADGPVTPERPRAVDAFERVYDAPAREFRLSVIELPGGREAVREVSGPEILFVTSGAATVDELAVAKGAAAFVPAEQARYTLRATAGSATVYRATVNL